jgi:hypothetical protein
MVKAKLIPNVQAKTLIPEIVATMPHLQKYVAEYAFRYNHRKDDRNMFWTMMDRVISHAQG